MFAKPMYAKVEVLGHSVYHAEVYEVEVLGVKMLRCQPVLARDGSHDGPAVLVSAAAIFRITPYADFAALRDRMPRAIPITPALGFGDDEDCAVDLDEEHDDDATRPF